MPKGNKPRMCAVRGCPGDRDLTKTYARLNPLPGEPPLSFFRVPAIISRYNPRYRGQKEENLERLIEISTNRRNAWLKAIRKENEPPDKCIKVCARHFVSGRPAKFEDQTNVDWVPTLKLVPEDNPLAKAKFLIKKLVQRQRDTSFRLKYGLSSEDESKELKEARIEPIESYADSSSSAVLSEAEGVEEVLIREDARNGSRAEKIKEIFIPGELNIEPRAKRKNEVAFERKEPKSEPRAKKMKEVLVRKQPTEDSIVNEIEEIFVPRKPKSEPILEEAAPSVESSIETIESLLKRGEIFLDNEATNSNITEAASSVELSTETIENRLEEGEIFLDKEATNSNSTEAAPSVESSIETIENRLEEGEISLDDEAISSNNTEAAPSVESSIEPIESLLEKSGIFLDNEATNSNITNYMLQNSDDDKGHWHLRFCKTEKCTPKEENDCEIANDAQAQPSEQKGHYHLRHCTCTSCVLSQSVDQMYSLKGA